MERFKRFDDRKLDSLRARYRGDDLFRTWARPLCQLENQLGELNAVEVWSETEMLRQRLADVNEHPDAEAEFFYGQLKSRHQSERTAIVILAVLFSQMADAAPDDDAAAERNPNRAVCSVLAHVLMAPEHRAFAEKLIHVFKSRRYDNEGRKIVLPVTDYMDLRSPLQLMDDAAKASVEACVGAILELTQGLKRMLTVSWEVYASVWRDICAMEEVCLLMVKVEPRNNRWGKNLKLVANVVGMMSGIKHGEKAVVEGSAAALSKVFPSNVRSCIMYHADFGSSNTPLTRELHTRIKRLIETAVADAAAAADKG